MNRLFLALFVFGVGACFEPAWSDEEPAPEWQAKFNEVYRLADGENAKRIPTPFMEARQAYHRKHHPQVGDHPGSYGFEFKNGNIKQRKWTSVTGNVAFALGMADIDVADLEGTRDAFLIEAPGDWIVRHGASRDAILSDIQKELTKATNGRISIEPAKIEKDVIVVRGTYAFKPMPNAPREPNTIHLFTDAMDTQEGAGGGTASMDGFLRRLGDVTGLKVINEAELHKGNVEWTNNRSDGNATKSAEQRDVLLKNVSEQTALQFSIERRTVDVWKVIDTSEQSGGL